MDFRRWHWRAFLTGGGSAFWLLAYGIVYWALRLSLDSFTSTVLYMGYLLLLALFDFLITGTSPIRSICGSRPPVRVPHRWRVSRCIACMRVACVALASCIVYVMPCWTVDSCVSPFHRNHRLPRDVLGSPATVQCHPGRLRAGRQARSRVRATISLLFSSVLDVSLSLHGSMLGVVGMRAEHHSFHYPVYSRQLTIKMRNIRPCGTTLVLLYFKTTTATFWLPARKKASRPSMRSVEDNFW